MADLESLRAAFQELYGAKPFAIWSAPGRVNLIGEHTDYNEGFVLPMAINRRTFVAAASRADGRVRVASLDLKETAEFSLSNAAIPQGSWLSYIEGMARVLQERGLKLTGADLAISSGVPMGAGLSSSAALEISIGLAFISLSQAEIDGVQLALAGQQVEHIYVGAKSGVMDQLTAVEATRGHALLIDCRSLRTEQIPLNLADCAVVVCDTKVKHELASSEYNLRREECERGAELLGQWLPNVRSLRDVSEAEFAQFEARLPEPVKSRCRHVVTENARTLRAADALRAGDLAELGRLMAASHESLRDDFQVSCRELDLMVALARRAGAIGARMTGGGFGGCTVNIVHRAELEEFRQSVAGEYERETKIEPSIYLVEADEGARESKDERMKDEG